MVKYTFLLPAFKVRFLKSMLESIQHQSYKDYRVIISDDCSPEDVYSVCSPYLADTRFTYRRNENNMGGNSLVSHWNKLIECSESDYLIMASDDDYYESNFLAEIDSLICKYPEVDLFRARAEAIDENESVFKRDTLYEEKVDQLNYMLQYEQPCYVTCVGNFVYKTRALKEIGGFVDYPLAWKSDTMTANLLASNGVSNTKDVLFKFRVSGLNISSDNNKEVLQKKYKATFLKDQDMTLLISNLSTTKSSKLESTLLSIIKQKHIERTLSELDMFAVSLPIDDLVSAIYCFYSKHYFKSKFQILLLIKKWIYYHLHN